MGRLVYGIAERYRGPIRAGRRVRGSNDPGTTTLLRLPAQEVVLQGNYVSPAAAAGGGQVSAAFHMLSVTTSEPAAELQVRPWDGAPCEAPLWRCEPVLWRCGPVTVAL